MKNILIIRTCNLVVFDDLITYINDKYTEEVNIYCLIQENVIDEFKSKYAFLKPINMKNGKIKYWHNRNICKDIQKYEFDIMFIPSSYDNFNGFEDIFMIATKIKADKYMLFNVNNEILEKKLEFHKILFNKHLFNLTYKIKVPIIIIIIMILYTIFFIFHKIKQCQYNGRIQ